MKTKEVFFGLIIGITANCVGVLLTVIILFSEYRLTNIIELINSSIDNNYITKLISLGADSFLPRVLTIGVFTYCFAKKS